MEGGQKGKDTFKDPLNEHFVHRYECIIDVNMCRRCNKQDSVIELLSIRYMDVERGGNLRKVIALGRGEELLSFRRTSHFNNSLEFSSDAGRS